MELKMRHHVKTREAKLIFNGETSDKCFRPFKFDFNLREWPDDLTTFLRARGFCLSGFSSDVCKDGQFCLLFSNKV